MLIEQGNFLETKCDALVVPSCGFRESDSDAAYVNDGSGLIIANAYPIIRRVLGRRLMAEGNAVYLLSDPSSKIKALTNWDEGSMILNYHLVNFPCKPTWLYINNYSEDKLNKQYQRRARELERAPGYMAETSLKMVKLSVKELEDLVSSNKWERIAVPEFPEKEINDYLISTLDNKYILVVGEQQA